MQNFSHTEKAADLGHLRPRPLALLHPQPNPTPRVSPSHRKTAQRWRPIDAPDAQHLVWDPPTHRPQRSGRAPSQRGWKPGATLCQIQTRAWMVDPEDRRLHDRLAEDETRRLTGNQNRSKPKRGTTGTDGPSELHNDVRVDRPRTSDGPARLNGPTLTTQRINRTGAHFSGSGSSIGGLGSGCEEVGLRRLARCLGRRGEGQRHAVTRARCLQTLETRCGGTGRRSA
eukprot:3077032-Rhodomonas_salina.2